MSLRSHWALRQLKCFSVRNGSRMHLCSVWAKMTGSSCSSLQVSFFLGGVKMELLPVHYVTEHIPFLGRIHPSMRCTLYSARRSVVLWQSFVLIIVPCEKSPNIFTRWYFQLQLWTEWLWAGLLVSCLPYLCPCIWAGLICCRSLANGVHNQVIRAWKSWGPRLSSPQDSDWCILVILGCCGLYES